MRQPLAFLLLTALLLLVLPPVDSASSGVNDVGQKLKSDEVKPAGATSGRVSGTGASA
jgi:hypothetical protein